MAKYIIELEDEPYMREDGVNYYTCKSARWYKLGETIINRLTPYTEPDREDIEDEVWSFAWKIFIMDIREFAEIFDDDGCPSDYREAKAKYDAWKKSKEEVHVGDEVEDDDGTRGIVFDIIGTDLLGVCWEEERVSHFFWPKSYCRKTGRHFDEVDRLLERMRRK